MMDPGIPDRKLNPGGNETLDHPKLGHGIYCSEFEDCPSTNLKYQQEPHNRTARAKWRSGNMNYS